MKLYYQEGSRKEESIVPIVQENAIKHYSLNKWINCIRYLVCT